MITICTPSYNRAHTLPRLYNSLINNTYQDFEWIIIDDGSTDNTNEIVKYFIDEGKIKTKYFFQKNQGKHLALNKGQKEAAGEIFTCIDSDDWLTKDALRVIIDSFQEIWNHEKVGGVIFLDKYINEEVLGSQLPHKVNLNWIDLIFKYKMNGDKHYAFKTKIIKEIPFYSFDNNNHMPPSYQYYLLSRHFVLYCINEPVKYVEYMSDGISTNIVKKYFSAPENYTYYRKVIHGLLPNVKSRLKNSIHYNITWGLSKNINKLKSNNFRQKVENTFMLPFGRLLLIYLKVKRRW